MKTRSYLWFWCACAILAAGAAVATATPPPAAYQHALFLERGAGDPAAACAAYEQVAADPAAGAGLAARARWRAGLCLELLGRRNEAAARQLELLAAPAEAPAEVREVQEAAAHALLHMAEEETAGAEPARPAAEWRAAVQARFPQLAQQAVGELAALRRTLGGVVETWDGRRPVHAGIRIRARPAVAGGPVEARATWRTQTDAEGRFAIELPVNRYEVRIAAPGYDRVQATAEITPEEETPPEMRCVLPRIRLPAEIHRVELMGSFLDDWEGILPLARTGAGIWEARQRLGPGRHEYKFRVNGGSRLVTDPAAAAFAADTHDDFNARLDLDREQEVVFRFDENDPRFERRPAGAEPADDP